MSYRSQIATLRREQEKNYNLLMKRKMYQRGNPYAAAESAALAKRRTSTGRVYRARGSAPGYSFRSPAVIKGATYGSRAGIELKGLDTDIDDANVLATTATNGAIYVCNAITPGSGSYNRVGRKITMKSLRIKGQVIFEFGQAATTGNISGNTLRCVVVYDKQPSGAYPTFDDIFGRTITIGTESTEYLDNLKYDNTDRFSVLSDQVFDCNPTLYNASGGTENLQFHVKSFDKFIPLKGLETQFSGQTSPTTIADISSGALYVIYRVRVSTANVTEASVQNSVARLRFYG